MLYTLSDRPIGIPRNICPSIGTHYFEALGPLHLAITEWSSYYNWTKVFKVNRGLLRFSLKRSKYNLQLLMSDKQETNLQCFCIYIPYSSPRWLSLAVLHLSSALCHWRVICRRRLYPCWPLHHFCLASICVPFIVWYSNILLYFK